MSSAIHWPERFAEMMDFVELSEEDRQLIKASASIINKNARSLTNTIYDRFLQYPQARKFFVTAQDEPDEKRIEANRQTMISWLRASAAAPLNEGFARYLAGISQMHANTPLHRPPLSPVAPRYIIGAISFYQTALADLLKKNLPDPDLAARTSVAWNKWLLVSLELLLANYLLYDEES